jgi:Zn ribbon nucleic-acid-binding protein
MVTCPHCSEEFQLDDYWDYSQGDTFDCEECGREIHILNMEVITTVRLSTDKEK